jgi:hypothetical protein
MSFEYSHKDVLFDELEMAIYKENMQKITYLVNHLGINYQTDNKRNILHFCLEEAHNSKLFHHLITRYNPNIDIRNGREETLLFAATMPEDIALLVSRNINLEAFNIDAQTALEHMCQNKSYEENTLECVKMLINYGADYEGIILTNDMYEPFKENLEKLLELKKVEKEKMSLENNLNIDVKKDVNKLKL